MSERDDHIRRGFDAGNYANAYETTDYDAAIAALSPNRSAEYQAAFTLGFFGSYERSEMGSDVEAFDEAYALVGKRAGELGIAVERDDDEPDDDEPETVSMTFGVMPSLEAFEAAFDRECPDGTFAFGNDPYVGYDNLSCSQLWRELQTQLATHDAGEHAPHCPGDGSCRGDGCPCEDAGSWCSSVLGILGFEWI